MLSSRVYQFIKDTRQGLRLQVLSQQLCLQGIYLPEMGKTGRAFQRKMLEDGLASKFTLLEEGLAVFNCMQWIHVLTRYISGVSQEKQL